MARTHQIVCQCGGEIDRPIPSHCPHCGAKIVGIRQSILGSLLPFLAVGLIFALLVGVLIYLGNQN
jgi:hypothetical protein